MYFTCAVIRGGPVALALCPASCVLGTRHARLPASPRGCAGAAHRPQHASVHLRLGQAIITLRILLPGHESVVELEIHHGRPCPAVHCPRQTEQSIDPRRRRWNHQVPLYTPLFRGPARRSRPRPSYCGSTRRPSCRPAGSRPCPRPHHPRSPPATSSPPRPAPAHTSLSPRTHVMHARSNPRQSRWTGPSLHVPVQRRVPVRARTQLPQMPPSSTTPKHRYPSSGSGSLS